MSDLADVEKEVSKLAATVDDLRFTARDHANDSKHMKEALDEIRQDLKGIRSAVDRSEGADIMTQIRENEARDRERDKQIHKMLGMFDAMRQGLEESGITINVDANTNIAGDAQGDVAGGSIQK